MAGHTRSFGGDQGQVLILTALSMTVLLGVAALTLDASFMYDKRNRLYAAADAAAKSGAIEVHRNSGASQTALEAFADQQVVAHGFFPSRLGGTTTVTVNHPPTSGPFSGNTNYVEVFASEVTPTAVGVLFNLANMTPGARAVAGTSPALPCIITLAPPGSSPISFYLGSSSSLTMPGCTVEVGGDLFMQSSANIGADGTSVVGVVRIRAAAARTSRTCRPTQRHRAIRFRTSRSRPIPAVVARPHSQAAALLRHSHRAATRPLTAAPLV